MEIDLQLTSDPIGQPGPLPGSTAAGAVVEFRGVVRGQEAGEAIAALEYEAYEPMAERELRRIVSDLAHRHPCLGVRVIHRVGVVPVGEAAIYVGVAGKHRAEAFAWLAEFMDRLKQEVPIWKTRAIPRETPPPVSPAGASTPSVAPAPTGVHTALEVIALVRQLCRPVEAERVCLAQADGRVLREAICAPEDQPPFDRSSVDGYAVRADDPSDRFRVVDEIRAGEWKPRELRRGETVRVATGGAVPCQGLQVLMKEEVRAHDGEVQVMQRGIEPNIRWRGEDARAGTVLVQPGGRLHAGTMGLLASLGNVQPLVSRPLRVLHLATGNEIVPPEQALGPGQIRDSNSSLVRAFLAPWGVALHQRRVAEDPTALRQTLAGAEVPSAPWDLWLISGGASVGEHDFTRAALADAGFQILVSRTNARPGKPLILAQRGPTLAFGLPGNPLAHFVCLHLYVRAALEAWLGVCPPRSFEAGTLGTELDAGGAGRETFWPARSQLADGMVRVFPLRWQSSGDLTALAQANALLRLASGARVVPAGSRVAFWRTDNDA